MKRPSFDVLIPHSRHRPNWETPKAEALFNSFIDNGFSYDEMSNAPDYLVFASAELLFLILPKMIDEMLERNDTVNFLIYSMLSAIDIN